MLLNELQNQGVSFAEYGLNLAHERKEYFSNIMPLSYERQALFEKEAENSLKKQQSIEAQDQLPFDEYLKNYFSS
jgi:glutamate--cysteine ligase